MIGSSFSTNDRNWRAINSSKEAIKIENFDLDGSDGVWSHEIDNFCPLCEIIIYLWYMASLDVDGIWSRRCHWLLTVSHGFLIARPFHDKNGQRRKRPSSTISGLTAGECGSFLIFFGRLYHKQLHGMRVTVRQEQRAQPKPPLCVYITIWYVRNSMHCAK